VACDSEAWGHHQAGPLFRLQKAVGAAMRAGGQPGPLQGSADNRWWMGMPEGESGAGQEAQQGDLRDAQHEQVLPEGGTMSCAPGAGRLGTLLHGEQLRPGS
jgi:hypothetical protein